MNARVMAATLGLAAILLAAGGAAQAVNIETVPVGNPGNAGELSGAGAGGHGPDRICGAVDYEYNIGKYEVTAGQYTEFLNAVAATDTYGLYNTNMWDGTYGCKIQRTGSPGSYTYAVTTDRADRPVDYVSWGDAARFCNWLTNGQPTGAQNDNTTEDGSYDLNGATSDGDLIAVTRKTPAQGGRCYIPTEDEWYKAAYHKNDPGAPGGNYFNYPTSSDTIPSNDLIDPDPGNNANYYRSGFTIGGPYWTTSVAEFENSPSPYGTYDQGGNLWEWNEAIVYAGFRGNRGGSFNGHSGYMTASMRNDPYPRTEYYDIGFRVSEVPEPGSAALLLISVVGLLARRRRR